MNAQNVAAAQAIPKPIIFLDIDGVLNDLDRERGQPRPGRFVDFKPDCVKAFNSIIDATGAEIVLSSNWRGYIINGFISLLGFGVLLRSHGIVGKLIGHTRETDETGGREEPRCLQIGDWLRDNPGSYSKLCILDDRADAFGGRPGVQTDPSRGLAVSDAMKAIKVLT